MTINNQRSIKAPYTKDYYRKKECGITLCRGVGANMVVSIVRRSFRAFLGFMLVLSMMFFGISSYYHNAIKSNKVDISSIAPILFTIDIYGHYAKFYIISKDEKLDMAKELFRKGQFDHSYRVTGANMMTALADNGHAPSQVYLADLLISYREREKAEEYYKAAAGQGYKPAQQKLAFLNIE